MPSEPKPPGQQLKQEVQAFWQREACGERYAKGDDLESQLRAQAETKYKLEPYIPRMACFEDGRQKRVLEIGVGMGVDHAEWARHSPAYLAGVDLTARAIEFTSARLRFHGLSSDLRVGDAENLPFDDESFDLVYSWGVLHHTADPERAVAEVFRVLKKGGEARIMLYHKYGFVFLLLWARYALLSGKPGRSVDDVVWHHSESLGTRAFTPSSARALFRGFSSCHCQVFLSHGDLLEGDVGQRHKSLALTLVKLFWPRPLVRWLGEGRGSGLFIRARK